ncbi:glycosyltransferase [Solemya velum gill symbiont]|uniref:glycosyltransferase n=1 Tax=Solemya velum gill symbiont TaxID=2340 RepID=UPI0018A841C5|nr:glycosyltransferase [Solemya velum gill symbiont]
MRKTDTKHDYPLIIVTKQLEAEPTGGRELLCKLNYDVLLHIYGKQLTLMELPILPCKRALDILNAFRGHIDGLDADMISSIIKSIRETGATKVFVDGSNLGGFVITLKKTLPEIEITTFFHNVESRFFLGSFRQRKSLRAIAVLAANYLAERKSVNYSDKIICLNQRDSLLLNKVYGRGATHIAPMALEDKMENRFDAQQETHGELFALFVGGTFYANQSGITWFVKNVVPHINIRICIVGRGFEKLHDELEVPGKVEVIGAVDSLDEWYRRARFVIAPIFDGSGMKTKVAEALMFGKKIIGTPEAFTGYEDISGEAGWVCNTVDEFVLAIEQANIEVQSSFDSSLRNLYEQNYSFNAAVEQYKSILIAPEDSLQNV